MKKSKIITAVLVVFIMTAVISVNVSASESLAQFIDIDKTTRGDWVGNYGTEGYVIISGNPAHQDIPSYADIIFESDWGGNLPAFWTWWDEDNDGLHGDAARRQTGALFKTPEKTSRIAACYFSGGTFLVNVDVGNESKIISLYMHDYDEHSRSALVYVINEDHSDYIIEPIEVEQYTAGWYLRFQITGRVRFTIEDTSSNGMNAVLSGVFLDPADPNIILTAGEINGADTPGDSDLYEPYNPFSLYEDESASIFDDEFIMALVLLGIIYAVLLWGAATLTSRIVDKIQNKKTA